MGKHQGEKENKSFRKQEASETPLQSCKMNGCPVIISSCRHCTGWINDAILGSVRHWTPVRINRTNFKVKLPRHISDNLYCFRLKCEIYIKLTSSSWNVSKVQRLAGETIRRSVRWLCSVSPISMDIFLGHLFSFYSVRYWGRFRSYIQ